MRVYNRKELTWVKNSLWVGDTYICAIVPDETYGNMFWIKWPNGDKSTDFYSLTRAKDHAVNLALEDLNLNTQETAREAR